MALVPILQKYYPDLSHHKIGQLDFVPIDVQSLRSYITANPFVEYIDRAKHILKIVNECSHLSITSSPVLHYKIHQSPFGRRYHRGVNLQNCKKVIRHATLVACFEYDINTAVIAVKLGMVNKAIVWKLNNLLYFTPTEKPWTEESVRKLRNMIKGKYESKNHFISFISAWKDSNKLSPSNRL